MNGPIITTHDSEDAAEHTDGRRGWSSFENLFRMSPTPTMEQDYSGVLAWMEELRLAGVTDITPLLGDIDAVREIAPLIRIVAANPAAVRAVGLPPEQLLGPVNPLIVNDEALAGWVAQLEAVWTGTPVVSASFVAATPSGRRYDAESTLSAPVIDGVPDFTRAVFTISDVTDHRNEERRMQTLVEGLLVAARAETGQIQVARTTFDVTRQVREMLAVGGSYAQNIGFSVPEQPVRAFGDPARVRQVLRNLLTNAERYGGPVVSVQVASRPGFVTVSVCDNGPGIPPLQREQVFELYHTAHDTPGTPGSVGIGLAVSRQLAELMGGSLAYIQRPGHSAFQLELKAAKS